MSSIADQNRIAYNYLADSYAKEWADKPDLQLANDFISFLPTDAKILDIGCGPGHYSAYFYERGFKVKGIDSSDMMISIAKKSCNKIEFKVEDMRSLNFADNEFDALWACSSFVHIPTEETARVLEGFKRILKDNGILFINAVIGDKPYRLETEDEIGGTYKGNGRYFQWYPDSLSFIEILAASGFDVVKAYNKDVTSHVVENATIRTTQWFNYICRQHMM